MRTPSRPGAGRLAALVAVALLAGASSGTTQQPAAPSRAWELLLPSGVVDWAFSPGEDCLAVAVTDRIVILDTTGTIRWEIPFSRLGRWADVGRVAAGPGCDLVVAGGTASSRYVWLVTRSTVRSARTRGTPSGLAVTHDGRLVAIGTAAGVLYLVSPDGRVISTRRFSSPILDELLFSPDDRLIGLTRGSPVGVVSVDSGVVWTEDLGGTLSPNAAWDRFVTWWEPPHFSTLGVVALLDQDGTTRWTLPVHYPSAALAPDGSYAVVVGVPADTAQQENQADIAESRFLVVGPDGTRLAEGPSPYGRAVGVSASGEWFMVRVEGRDQGDTLVARGRDGETAWNLPIPLLSRLLVTRSLGLLIVADETRLAGYRYPGRSPQ